jgi:hypothetical protein
MNKIVKLGLKPDILSKLIFVSDHEDNAVYVLKSVRLSAVPTSSVLY